VWSYALHTEERAPSHVGLFSLDRQTLHSSLGLLLASSNYSTHVRFRWVAASNGGGGVIPWQYAEAGVSMLPQPETKSYIIV
jgi:hypothetical protein